MILYLGLDPSRWPHSGALLHYAVIRTALLDSAELRQALSLWPQFTHVIFTSRSTVRHWWEAQPSFDKIAIAIGEGTAEALRDRGVDPVVALEAVQEGVIALLDRMDLNGANLLLPQSKRARSQLRGYLEEKKIPFFAFDLYDTFPQKPEPVPSLEPISEIVFTSPSTVEAFLQIYGTFPKDKKLTAIGPVTARALRNWIK
jgi:uroporphyrinogen-III synthase